MQCYTTLDVLLTVFLISTASTNSITLKSPRCANVKVKSVSSMFPHIINISLYYTELPFAFCFNLRTSLLGTTRTFWGLSTISHGFLCFKILQLLRNCVFSTSPFMRRKRRFDFRCIHFCPSSCNICLLAWPRSPQLRIPSRWIFNVGISDHFSCEF